MNTIAALRLTPSQEEYFTANCPLHLQQDYMSGFEIHYQHCITLLRQRRMSLDALRRVIRHDGHHSFHQKIPHDCKVLARMSVITDINNGVIPADSYKERCEPGDPLFGNDWPIGVPSVA